jgi:hypothetical protein
LLIIAAHESTVSIVVGSKPRGEAFGIIGTAALTLIGVEVLIPIDLILLPLQFLAQEV